MNSRENNFSQKSEKGTARFAPATGQALRIRVKLSHLEWNEWAGLIIWAMVPISFAYAMIQRFN